MKYQIQKRVVIGVFLLIMPTLIYAPRSIHRPLDPREPSITVYWKNYPGNKYVLTSRYLEKYPFFETFDKNFFSQNLLPPGTITYRYEPEKTVTNDELSQLIENLICEINARKRHYTDFTVLRRLNFNRRKKAGLLIIKCNKHPFVVKLFMENPSTFVRPFRKGCVPGFFFFMGGGINRHLSGFTRIKNLHDFKKITGSSCEWANKIVTPRKWFWLPHDCRWLIIEGHNIEANQNLKTEIPGTYAIVEDLIAIDKKISPGRLKKESLRLCNDVKFTIDPHADNFVKEQGSGKLAIIDTEDFRAITGFRTDQNYDNRFKYYRDLVLKAAGNIFMHEKPDVD